MSTKERILGVLCYLGILLLVPFLWAAKSDNLKSHVNSGIIILAAWVLLLFVFQIPLFGIVLGLLLLISIIIFTVWGIYDAVRGFAAKIPGVEKVALIFK